MQKFLVVGLAASASAYSAPNVAAVRPRAAVQPALRSAPVQMVHGVTEASTLLSEAIEEVGPVLFSQIGAAGGLLAGGFGLNAFADVPEPEEFETPEGEVDIYRDSPLRFLGYANEVGEAFRPLVPVEVVYFSYVAAISYILADTVDKGKKGSEGPEGGAIRGTLGALDTFCWQMLASVLFPSFCINRVVTLLASLAEEGSLPDLLAAGWVPTVAGLALIPAIILPLDTLAHFTLNQSFRKGSAAINKSL